MKKYEIKDLEEAINVMDKRIGSIKVGKFQYGTKNVVINDFYKVIKEEHKNRTADKFVKATDSYLSKLTREDVCKRLLKEEDFGYYKGMYGMFEKATNKLLRRHTDLGFLSLPSEKR